MLNINITEIENGFLVATPPTKMQQDMAARNNQQAQMKVKYCEDFDDIVQALKAEWPIAGGK